MEKMGTKKVVTILLNVTRGIHVVYKQIERISDLV